jgi:NADH:ubiquinone oxidoreductase subunit 4 (subunit M)
VALGADVIEWIDVMLLPLLLGMPGLGLFFVAVMPSTERIALRHAGLGATIVTGLLALRATWLVVADGLSVHLATTWGGAVPGGMTLGLDVARVPALLAITVLMPMTLRAGAPRIIERTKGYVVLLLAFEGLALAALLSEHALLTLALLDASLVPLLLLLGLFGGVQKGSMALRVGMSWFLVDALAFAALVWLAVRAESSDVAGLRAAASTLELRWQLMVFVPVALSAGLRLAVAPACAWFVGFLREAPVSAAALATAVIMPLGGHLFVTYAVSVVPDAALASLPTVAMLGAGTALLGGLLAVVDRDLRALAAGAGMVHGGLALVGLGSLDPGATSAALLFLAAMGATTAFLLYGVDALERRYVTRDSTELFGVADELPGLWRLMLVGLLGVAGVPALGGGSLLLPLCAGVLRTDAFARAGLLSNVALALVTCAVVGLVLLGAAVVVALRRLSSPHFRQEARARAAFSPWQALRLWVPAVTIILAGIGMPMLLDPVERSVKGWLDDEPSRPAFVAPASEGEP